jgi:hypothetical protein
MIMNRIYRSNLHGTPAVPQRRSMVGVCGAGLDVHNLDSTYGQTSFIGHTKDGQSGTVSVEGRRQLNM